MKKLDRILVASLVIIFAGCEQSQQKETTGISRRDRLVANENLGLKKELAQCRGETEKQQNLLRQCEEEKGKIEQEAGDTEKWLLDKLPQSLLDDSATLSEENEKLTARIIELEKALKQSGRQEEQK
jgi:uncharacterized protein YlxW (UPF0749 family)